MKRRTLAPDRAALAEEIAGLSKAHVTNLREHWKNLYGKQSPGGLGRSFLIRAIAYRLQEQAFGGLKPLDPTGSRQGRRRGCGWELAEAPAGSKGRDGNDPGPPMARERAPGHGARRRHVLQRQALASSWIAVVPPTLCSARRCAFRNAMWRGGGLERPGRRRPGLPLGPARSGTRTR
jgi:Protein of unknown function (DUF2924)